MTAGLPGAGIGGIFYLASALLMPVRELWGFARDPRAPRRWGLALRQAALATGILAALWATGWLLALVLPETVRAPEAGGAGVVAGAVSRNAIRVSALVFSLGTLALVLGVVQAARVLVRRPPSEAPAPLRIPTPLAVRALRDPITARQRHPTRRRGQNSGQFPRFAS